VAPLSERYTLQQLCELAAEKDADFGPQGFADALAAAVVTRTPPLPNSAQDRRLSPPSP